MTTESEVDSVSSNMSLLPEDVSGSNSKESSTLNDPGQASDLNSQDSENCDTKVTGDDCPAIVSESIVRCNKELGPLNSPKSEGDQEMKDEGVEDVGEDSEKESELMKDSHDDPKAGGDNEIERSTEEGPSDQESASLDSSNSEDKANDSEQKMQALDSPISANIQTDEGKETQPMICSSGEDIAKSNSDTTLCDSSSAATLKESGDDNSTPTKASSSLNTPVSSNQKPSGGIRKSRAAKAPIDLTPQMLEQFHLPFKHGWKREVVNRNVTELGKRGQCDIYYFTPTGKKLRSMVEIDDWLNSHRDSPVQYKHFSFARMALFEPPMEIVRDAGKPRNSSSLQPKEKKTPKTKTVPNVRQALRLKLSSVLPKPSDISKSIPKSVPVTVSNGTTVKAPSQNQVPGRVLLPKRPLVKTTKYKGYSFIKKRRLSPEWKPWDEEDSKGPSRSNVEVIYPKTPPSENQATDEDDLQRILGTPSKLISSIVNPEPPKPVEPPPSFIQVSTPSGPSNVKVHIVSKKDANTTDILAQLGLNSKNVRMVNFPPQVSTLNMSTKPSDSRIVLVPATPRPFKPPGTILKRQDYPAISSNQSALPRFRPILPVTTIPGASISPLISSAPIITIPPPPPLAIRPQFNRFASNVTVLRPPPPPKLQFASMPANVLPDPPPLQMPLVRGRSILTESSLLTSSAGAPLNLTSAASGSSSLLQNLANKIQTPLPLLTTALNNPPLSALPLNNATPVSLPYALIPLDNSAQSNKSLLYKSLSQPSGANEEIEKLTGSKDSFSEGSRDFNDVTGESDANNSNGVLDLRTIEPSDSSDRGLSTKNIGSHSEIVSKAGSSVNEDDEDFSLPISFGVSHPSSDNLEPDPDNSISRLGDAQEVVLNSRLSHLDIYCPVSPASSADVGLIDLSSVCDLDDKDNVFFKFPASYFRSVHKDKQIVLKLNGNEIVMIPGFMKVEGEDVKLKTSVKELKQWMIKQALKMKICGGQKRKIVLTKSGQKSSYLRSFMLLHENYNIMMSIFKHLSVHDLLRACRVCKIWRRMALQKCLWRKLNLQLLGKINWIPAVNFFLNVDVRTLILPEPLVSPQDVTQASNLIIDRLSRLTQLKELHFGIVSQQLLDRVLDKMPNLKNLGADYIFDIDQETPSHVLSNTASTEIAMTRAVELVQSGGFSVSEAAVISGVLEADLAHLSQSNMGALRKLEQDSVLLGCMRLSRMGFVIDEAVIGSKLEEIMKKRSSSTKANHHTQRIICQRLLRNNYHLFQTKLPYRKNDTLVEKLKAYANSMESFYNEVGLKSSSNVLAFVMKDFRVLNAAGNKMHRVTALSVISPANLNLPVMLIFSVPVHYLEGLPDLILIASKEGLPTANLVTHYLRAVVQKVSARPLTIFFDGHENLLSLELVSECVEKCVHLQCVPKELSETVFPGNYGGILHSLSKQMGKDLMSEREFINLITFYLKEDWWANWQGMCRAFQVTGIFPFSSSAAVGLYRSILSNTLDSHLKGVEVDCGENSSDSSALSSDEEVAKEGDTERDEVVKSASKSEESSSSPEDEEETTQNKDDKSESKSTSPHEEPSQDNSAVSSPAVDSKAGEETQKRPPPSVPTTTINQNSKRKRESSSASENDSSDEGIWPEEVDTSEGEADAPGTAGSQRLFIHIDEDEKENKNTTKSPPRKKQKVEEPAKKMSSIDSIIKTIDSVIASSREYYEDCKDRKTHTSPSSAQKVVKGKEVKTEEKPSLKIKLFPKNAPSALNTDFRKDQESPSKGDNVKSDVSNLESSRLHEVSEEEEEEEEDPDTDDEMEEDNEEMSSGESEMKETDGASAKLPSGKDETSVDENESDVELNENVQLCAKESLSIHDKITLETSPTTKGHKKKKKRKKKKKLHGKENEAVSNLEEEANNKDGSSKKKKKKKRKKKKRSKKYEEDKNNSRVDAEKELDEKTDINDNDEMDVEKKDTEKSMMLMRRISLADHDYEAKFDSDSGHEITEEKVCEESRISETETSPQNDSQLAEQGQNPDELPAQKDKASKDETSESSSDSDSSKKSDSGSSSSGDSGSESSSGDEEDTSESKKGVDNEGSESSESDDSDNDKVESGSSEDDEDQSGAEKKENQSGESDTKSDGNQSEEDEDVLEDDKEEDQSEEEASSKAGSNEDLYSEDDEEDDNMDDDDSKCQLCMASNPPHSKDQIINWVDCDSNCGRWFHVICINRSQAKANPKRFVCPSCRCRR